MKLNKILNSILALAVISTVSVSSVWAETKVIVGDTGAPTSVIGRTLIVFKERAEKYSNGELKVEIFPNSQLGAFGSMATQMKINLVNVMFIQPDALGEQVPIVTANSWPFEFRNQDDMMKAWSGPGGKALIAEVEKRTGITFPMPKGVDKNAKPKVWTADLGALGKSKKAKCGKDD